MHDDGIYLYANGTQLRGNWHEGSFIGQQYTFIYVKEIGVKYVL